MIRSAYYAENSNLVVDRTIGADLYNGWREQIRKRRYDRSARRKNKSLRRDVENKNRKRSHEWAGYHTTTHLFFLFLTTGGSSAATIA